MQLFFYTHNFFFTHVTFFYTRNFFFTHATFFFTHATFFYARNFFLHKQLFLRTQLFLHNELSFTQAIFFWNTTNFFLENHTRTQPFVCLDYSFSLFLEVDGALNIGACAKSKRRKRAHCVHWKKLFYKMAGWLLFVLFMLLVRQDVCFSGFCHGISNQSNCSIW